MFDEPGELPMEGARDPLDRAREKCDEFRMHAELCAVFEGCRKQDARILNTLDPDTAADVQRSIARLEKSRIDNTPILKPDTWEDASRLLTLPEKGTVGTNDYYVCRRPGEAIVVRWLAGPQVDGFYSRLQAHFDAAHNQFRSDERDSHGWKQDPEIARYLDALDALEIRMADRYLRPTILEHRVFVLSTQSADEMDIVHLCDYLMGVDPAATVGQSSAPGESPSEQDRAWFFKLFSLRGIVADVECMCFFTFLQKSDEAAGW